MKLKNLLILTVVPLLSSACGSSSGSGPGTLSTDPSQPTNVTRPASAALNEKQINTLIQPSAALKIQSGMFAAYQFSVKMRYQGVDCNSSGKLLQVILKADQNAFYTYEMSDDRGSYQFSYDSDGKQKTTCSTSQNKTISVHKSPLPTSIKDLTKSSSDSSAETSFYAKQGQLQIYSESNNSFGDTKSIATFDDLKETPAFLALSAFQVSSEGAFNVENAGDKYTSFFSGKRESKGTNFQLESLRASLKSVQYCDDTQSTGSCQDAQDMSSLLP